jgi:hypothetical protein
MPRGTHSQAFWKTVPSSDFVADAMTLRMMELIVWMAPLYGGGVAVGLGAVYGSCGFELKKKVPLARLLAFASDK